MALNLLGSGFGNQNYTPVNPNAQGPLTNIISKYGKDSITRTRTTTSPGKPVTRTVTRTVAQPEMEYAKYQGPEEETARIPTKAVFGTTPKQRQTYVREVEDYNKQIRAEKQKVIDYNKEVEQWNKSGRFTKVTRTYTETPTVTKTTTTTIPFSKPTVTTTTTKPTVTTKTLTSKERLDAISQPRNYFQEISDKISSPEYKKLKFIESQELKRSTFDRNLRLGASIAYQTFKTKGVVGLDKAIQEQEKILYPQVKSRFLEGYKYVTGGQGFFKYTNPLFYISKGVEYTSRTFYNLGSSIRMSPKDTARQAYEGSLKLRGATIQSAKTVFSINPVSSFSSARRTISDNVSSSGDIRLLTMSAYKPAYKISEKAVSVYNSEEIKKLRTAIDQSAKTVFSINPVSSFSSARRTISDNVSSSGDIRLLTMSAYKPAQSTVRKIKEIDFEEDLKKTGTTFKKLGRAIVSPVIDAKPYDTEIKKVGPFNVMVAKKNEKYDIERRYLDAKATEVLTKPETYYFTAGLLAETAVFNLPKITKLFKDEWLKFGATYVDPKDVFSKQVFKDDKITTSLVRTKSVQDAFGTLSKTKGVYPQYPEHYVLQSSLQDDLPKTFGVLSQKQKVSRGLKVRYEDDVMWFGTKGEGAVWALRIAPDNKYRIGLLPNWAKPAQPAVLETLVKRGQRLPGDVLFQKGFDLQGEYQRFKTLTKPSIALFPKRSETSKIGYDLIRKKIKSIDPALRGSSELQFGTFPGTLNVPAKKLLTTPLGRFKGFEEYTIVYGQVIPIRKGIISGASIYTPGPRADLYKQFLKSKPLAVGQKGAVDIFSSKKISKSLNDYLYDYGLASHQRSIAQNYGKDAISLAYSNAINQSLIKIPIASFFRGLGSDSDSISKGNKYNIKLFDYDSRYNNNRDTSSRADSLAKKTYDTIPATYTPDITSTDTTSKYTETRTDYKYGDSRRVESSEYKSTPPTYYPNAPSRPSLTYKFDSGDTRYKFTPVIPKRQKKQISGEPAYDVLIKVGNKWVNKTNGKRNIYSAMHRGADIVDNTVAKSFKIKKGTGRANIFKYNAPYNINKFYTPSKTRSAKLTGAYIEKNKFAIDTPGERRGLSVAKYLRGVKLI